MILLHSISEMQYLRDYLRFFVVISQQLFEIEPIGHLIIGPAQIYIYLTGGPKNSFTCSSESSGKVMV